MELACLSPGPVWRMISPRFPAQTEDSVQFDGFEAVVGGEQRGPDSMKEVASWPWGHNLVTSYSLMSGVWRHVGCGARPSELYAYTQYYTVFAISLRTRWVMTGRVMKCSM